MLKHLTQIVALIQLQEHLQQIKQVIINLTVLWKLKPIQIGKAFFYTKMVQDILIWEYLQVQELQVEAI